MLDNYTTYALAAGDDQSLSKSQHQTLPQFPGEDSLQHVAMKWIETSVSRLAGMGLLSVARGGITPESAELRDTPQLPALPPEDPNFQRRLEARHRIASDNAQRAEKRYGNEMRAWNKLYNLVYASVEGVSTLLAKEIQTLCAIAPDGDGDGANFDGPRAWKIVIAVLSKTERTKNDKLYYKAAEELQLRHRLPDGCAAEEYSKKATAFVANIMPNLAQKYDPNDAGDYLIDLMPKNLRETGRRIREKLMREGRLADHMHVVRVCREMVAEEQATAKTQPTLIAATETDAFSMVALAETTGMALTAGGSAEMGMVANGSDGPKWCKGCPHPKGKCFLAPDFAGPLPVHIHVNEARRKGIEAGKKANATAHNVPLVRLKAPTKDAITRWKEKEKRRDDKSGAATGAQVGVDSDTLTSFLGDLMDVAVSEADARCSSPSTATGFAKPGGQRGTHVKRRSGRCSMNRAVGDLRSCAACLLGFQLKWESFQLVYISARRESFRRSH